MKSTADPRSNRSENTKRPLHRIHGPWRSRAFRQNSAQRRRIRHHASYWRDIPYALTIVQTGRPDRVLQKMSESQTAGGFLFDITTDILKTMDPANADQPIVSAILDKAGQKGTGKWASQIAYDLGVPVPQHQRSAKRKDTIQLQRPPHSSKRKTTATCLRPSRDHAIRTHLRSSPDKRDDLRIPARIPYDLSRIKGAWSMTCHFETSPGSGRVDA